jgi:TRAP-type mannitol/chloroaromatic compound transport system permease small subunit
MTFPLAHFGHWWGQLLFAAPVLLLFLFVGWDNIRQRWRGRRGERKDR